MLKDIIRFLKQRDPNEVPLIGFNNPQSYRGYYDQLAFEPCIGVTVAQMLDDCNYALNNTFEGYKGGTYSYDVYTDCWLSSYGCCSGQPITLFLLHLMFNELPDLKTNTYTYIHDL